MKGTELGNGADEEMEDESGRVRACVPLFIIGFPLFVDILKRVDIVASSVNKDYLIR